MLNNGFGLSPGEAEINKERTRSSTDLTLLNWR